MKLPPLHDFRLRNTHRLIPSRYSESGTVLSRLTGDEALLSDLAELDGATNSRLLGEEGLLPGIGIHELVYGVGYAHIVNAAFTHAAPSGGRFNGPQRGAWYAGLDRATALAEVAFHRLRQLEEVDWGEEEISTVDEYLADFHTEFHDLRGANTQYRRYLRAGPIPACYAAPQHLAGQLLSQQSNGVIYPSVRRPAGTCIVCFRPALVYHVRLHARIELRLHALRAFTPSQVREIRLPD